MTRAAMRQRVGAQLAVVLAAVVIGGCAPLPLNPGAQFVPPSPIEVRRTVGIHHSEAFRNETREVVGLRRAFAVGNASFRLLDAVYQTVFTRAVPVAGRPPVQSTPAVDAVLEPSIERFDVAVGPFVANRVLAWASVTYRFTMWSPSGDQLAAWTVNGVGEASGVGRDGRSAVIAVERALRDAAHRFTLSFLEVPEARRWARGLPMAGATAVSTEQTTRRDGPLTRVSYADVASLETTLERDESGVVSARLRVANEGRGRLIVRPGDIVLARGDATIRPAPVSQLAATLTTFHGRVGPAPPFAGVGTSGLRAMGVANIIGALVNLALAHAEQKAFDAAVARYAPAEGDDIRLWKDGTAEFTLHFLLREPTLTDGVLLVPIVDTDRATRYVLRVPVP
jgi:hypothetical protein